MRITAVCERACKISRSLSPHALPGDMTFRTAQLGVYGEPDGRRELGVVIRVHGNGLVLMEARALKRKLTVRWKAIQKTWHPGTWRQLVASRAA